MPLTVVQIPTVTMTTSQTNSAAVTGIDDASQIYMFLNSTTTSGANILNVQAEPTDTGTNWANLIPSGATAALTISSSQGTVLTNIAFRQMRFVATGVVGSTGQYSILLSKQLTV